MAVGGPYTGTVQVLVEVRSVIALFVGIRTYISLKYIEISTVYLYFLICLLVVEGPTGLHEDPKRLASRSRHQRHIHHTFPVFWRILLILSLKHYTKDTYCIYITGTITGKGDFRQYLKLLFMPQSPYR